MPAGADYTFSEVLEQIKADNSLRVARVGWNGKGMFIYYVPPGTYPACSPAIKGQFKDDMVPYGAYIAMKTAQGNVVPWLASQTDILAEDWLILT